MVLKFLGALDGACAFAFIASQYINLPNLPFYVIGIYLIFKGVLFTVLSSDPASIIDICCGLYAFLITLGLQHPFPTTIATFYLLQKAVFSFVRIR
ncbi:MAG: hypothetical protein V1859_02085 [archaeon]